MQLMLEALVSCWPRLKPGGAIKAGLLYIGDKCKIA